MAVEFSTLAEQYGDFYTPQFELKVGESGDTTIREHDGLVSGLSVESALNRASRFSFTLVDTFDVEKKSFRDPVWEHFAPGTPIRISLGYGAPFVPVLDGKIQSLRPDFPAGGAPTVEVSGYDRLHDLSAGTDTRSWTEETLAAAVDEVTEMDPETGRNDFDGRVIEDLALTEPFRKIDQEKTSDLEFLLKQANRYNFELFVRLDPDPRDETNYVETLYFRAPADDGDPTLTLTYGESLQSFSMEFNEASQVGNVVVRGWIGRRKRRVEETYSAEGVGGDVRPTQEREISGGKFDSEAEARLVAKAEYEKIRQSRVTATGDTVGLPDLRVGEVLALEGLSAAFSKPYYVTSVTHRIGESGYTTNVGVRLPNAETIPLETSS